MDTRITIIVDNKASEGLISEHGLSFWVESGGKRILFDTGQGAALKGNTASLGIDLSSADTLVVSHGHYDHTGGMPYVIEQTPEIRLYCHPGVVQPRYVIRDNNPKSIGMPRKAREALHNLLPERIAWVQEPLMLTDTIGLTGPIPRLTTYEDTGGAF